MKNLPNYQFINKACKPVNKESIKTLYLLAFITLGFALSAQETTWNGSQNSNWATDANWSNGIPDADTKVYINSSNNDPVITGDAIIFEAGEEILLQGGFEVQQGSTFTARIRACGEVVENVQEAVEAQGLLVFLLRMSSIEDGMS